ncbi:MAG: hypothetical protein V2B20_11315 [Pseudomonadota bacterium]
MKWLDRLKGEEHPLEVLPKLTKDPCDSFGSTMGRHIPENESGFQVSKPAEAVGLDSVPDICRGCDRIEIVNIMGKPIPGCVYPITSGAWTEGWRKVRKDLNKCLWH